jgi:Mitochondrial carrier protein
MPAEPQADHTSNTLQNGSARPPPLSTMPQQHGSQPTGTGSGSGSGNGSNNDGRKATGSNGSNSGNGSNMSTTNRLVKRYRVEVAASASSVLSTMTTFPLDSVKTRMQTYKYAGFRDCVRHTYQTEKFRGFFRGTCGGNICGKCDADHHMSHPQA